MKKLLYALSIPFLILLGCGSNISSASDTNDTLSSYTIGHKALQFFDTSRDNRDITAELYFPSKDDKTSVADGSFPLIVFAHGYQQRYSDYNYLWKSLVPLGFSTAFLTTEQGLTIDIDTYAEDITFLHAKLLSADSMLAGHLTETSALMGHSTGGGAIYLAQSQSPQSATLISLAALGRPYASVYGSSPIDAADTITIPSLIVSGENDCITDPLIHQKPLYDNLLGDKTMITIKDADHCGFSDSLNCPVGESLACGLFFQGTTIEDAAQRALTIEIITPWLKHFLKNDSDAWSSFTSAMDKNVETVSSF